MYRASGNRKLRQSQSLLYAYKGIPGHWFSGVWVGCTTTKDATESLVRVVDGLSLQGLECILAALAGISTP